MACTLAGPDADMAAALRRGRMHTVRAKRGRLLRVGAVLACASFEQAALDAAELLK